MTDSSHNSEVERALESERSMLLRQLVTGLEKPMVVLGFVWLALLVIELVRGLSPVLTHIGTAIWIIFILDFLLEFIVAPRKGVYLQHNWLTAVSLAIPALRVFRIVRAFRAFRLARAARQLRLVRVLTSLNRGMRALAATLKRRGFGYVAALTLIVALAGAAGMYAFESNPGGPGLNSYPTALWWTAMLLASFGTDYWPVSTEGRILCVVLALYGLGILGYITATLATFLIGREAEHAEGEIAGENALNALRSEMALLRDELRAMDHRRDEPNA